MVFLKNIGVWDAIPAEHRVAVHAMRIYGDQASSLEFDAYSAGVPELAWIVEDRLLQEALWRGLEVDVVASQPERLAILEDRAVLTLQGRTLEASLVVGADGASSFVRRAAGIAARERDYGQHAVVANFRCEKPHANVAYQWFQHGAVLAFLPLPGEHVFDGEVVVLEEGKPNFERMLERKGVTSPEIVSRRSLRLPATYVAFDLLYADGEELLDAPLCERRKRLTDD